MFFICLSVHTGTAGPVHGPVWGVPPSGPDNVYIMPCAVRLFEDFLVNNSE